MSRASLEATGRRHWASIMSDNKGADMARTFFLCFHRQNRRKRSRVDAKNPVFNRGTYDISNEREGLNKGKYIICWGDYHDRITYGGVVWLTWRNPVRVASPHRINLEEPGQGGQPT